MVLEQQSPSKHNQMLGKKQTTLIPHPKSTKYDDDAQKRPLKRIKRDSDTDDLDLAHAPDSPKLSARVVPDSDAESDDEDSDAPKPTVRTDLESALPPIETDKEAIEAYEISRAAEETEKLSQEGRLREGKWIKGRSSIYVDAFNLALDTVLEEERHLFDEAEIEVFSQWRALDYEAQYLYDFCLKWRGESSWLQQIRPPLPPEDVSMASHQYFRLPQRYIRHGCSHRDPPKTNTLARVKCTCPEQSRRA